jgi:hypothetical protein
VLIEALLAYRGKRMTLSADDAAIVRSTLRARTLARGEENERISYVLLAAELRPAAGGGALTWIKK